MIPPPTARSHDLDRKQRSNRKDSDTETETVKDLGGGYRAGMQRRQVQMQHRQTQTTHSNAFSMPRFFFFFFLNNQLTQTLI